MRRVAGLTIVLVLLAGVGVASARPGHVARNADGRDGARTRVLSRRSRSIGLPWSGSLRNGVRAVETRYIRYATEYRDHDRFYGTWELVQLLERAAYRVSQRVGGARLSIGELSAAGGGEIAGHSSHENGRDADVAFYMLDAGLQPFEPYAFAAFDGDGRAGGANRGLRFDDRRNFELVARLVTDGDARVQHIFVSNPIRRRLLAVGRALGAPRVIQERLERVLMQPSGAHRHENHFHVRIYCAPADRPSCVDRAPFHSWYPGEPPIEPAPVASR
jgi:penicillin-insensitive murein endopeptidase